MNFNWWYLFLVVGIAVSWHSPASALPLSLWSTWVIFFSLNQHVALGLIQLEILTMIGSLLIVLCGSGGLTGLTLILILFAVGVVEAALGLSLLALSSRNQSLELFKMTI